MLQVIEEESVLDWVDAIWQVLRNHENLTLYELMKILRLSIGKVWLGLLLGGFQLQQQGEFYRGEILLSQLCNKS